MGKTPSTKPVVGITLGDPAGIGPEVIARSLAQAKIRDLAQYVIIGEKAAFTGHALPVPECPFINPHPLAGQDILPGKNTRQTAQASLAYLKKSVEMIKAKDIQALVTGPVSKEAITTLGEKFIGHTEFLAQAFNVQHVEMMFIGKTLRTVVVTRHVPIKDLSGLITIPKVYSAIELTDSSLKRFFHIEKPQIAVCGLNPHAGEGGAIGQEEITVIKPAMEKAIQAGMCVHGPFAADTLFSPVTACRYDAVIAMYHDQGLIPIKTLYFQELVNFTVGLPFIRTSPAHGTAFNIAGKGLADPSSMAEAIKLAATLAQIPK